ncbi:conserved hypothetical protein [Thiomonas sp. X19]|uniref:toxin-antitoxin system TumE family protein n=1 Tax=Thiomonas sp. X19 TaxID=1050370 RepID=UPI000B6A5DBC|nr:DUF6516 family protein [Thiomonas sp. X19]SCC95260.1 conserved hypothetical protein [Thiomonas sp. X19]
MPPRNNAAVLLERERFEIKSKSGGGLLSYEVWGVVEQGKTVVTRYNLAYINHAVCPVDNGRVLGYDNAHGYHHKHHMGTVEPMEFTSYEATLERFQQEVAAILQSVKEKKR